MIFDVEIHLENWPTGQATKCGMGSIEVFAIAGHVLCMVFVRRYQIETVLSCTPIKMS